MGGQYLHGDQAVVDENLLCQEVGTDSCFVACAELLVDLRYIRLSIRLFADVVRIMLTTCGVIGMVCVHIGSSNSSFQRRCHQG